MLRQQRELGTPISARYAVSGTERASGTCQVLTYCILISCYAVASTGVLKLTSTGATRCPGVLAEVAEVEESQVHLPTPLLREARY
eukprot:3821923-Rhodomonas_salina.1